MSQKTVKHKNIPIFIPHLGCPNMCVFCNQRSISGKQGFSKETVKAEIERALETISPESEVEIAYFGGSFTGIDRDLMLYLLDLAKLYAESPKEETARVSGIRMSTRPDYINEEIMEILSHYPVKTVELGLQSMDDEVLMRSARGHTAKQAENACQMIKDAGYALVGQMMIGLPGSTLEKEIFTAERICQMGADAARIYPTVTFYDTELARMAQRGEYEMLETEDAVYRAKETLKVFDANGVDCIRIGLCASDNLMDPDTVMGGANHPALGELVFGELYYDRLCELIEKNGGREAVRGRSVRFSIPVGDMSKAIGQKGLNRKRLIENYLLKGVIFAEHADINEIIVYFC